LAPALLVTGIAGCSTEIYAPSDQNPAPPSRSRSFGQFKLESVTLNPSLAEHGYNQASGSCGNRALSSRRRTLTCTPYRRQRRDAQDDGRDDGVPMSRSSRLIYLTA
jgi:hypothetical protein